MGKKVSNRKKKHLLNQTIHPDAAGIDIGAEELVVAVPSDRDQIPVRTFATFTGDLNTLCTWLDSLKITTVAMESTGTYWIPVYETLQDAGIEVCLVNARHVKGVPGKKTDVCDAQWLQQLHTAGLLKASFRPAAEVVAVRHIVRHRSQLIKDASRHLLHMQKALTEMNLKLHHVFSDLDGASAMSIIEAILDGQRDPEVLWQLRDKRCRTSKTSFLKAMEGNWQPSQLFILKQCHTTWTQTRNAISECDGMIELLMSAIPAQTDSKLPDAPKSKRRHNKNDLSFDIFQEAYRVYGVDLSTIDGISAGTLSILIGELGNAEDILTNFKTGKAFASWLGLCPDNRISGGKILKSKTRHIANRVSAALRMAAQGLGHAKSEMGEYCRRMKGRLGKAEGITAVAHKLARLIYALIQSKEPYNPTKAFRITEKTWARRLKNLEKLAKSMQMELIPAIPINKGI
ncbi:MAG: IS110 family transposase [Opitutae bacterium]|nr:IS110 family transposase [Opitutae bacterium]